MPTVTYDSPSSGGYNLTVPREGVDLGSGGGPMGDLSWLEAIAKKNAILKGKKSKLEYQMMKRESERPDVFVDPRATEARPDMPLNTMIGVKDYLDRMNEANPAFAHGQGLLGTNKEYFNLPAAGSMMSLYGKNPVGFDTKGWDLYSDAIKAQAGQNEQFGKAQGMTATNSLGGEMTPSPRSTGPLGASDLSGAPPPSNGAPQEEEENQGSGMAPTASIRPASYIPLPRRKRPMTRGGQPDLFSTGSTVRA